MLNDNILIGLEKCARRSLGYETEDLKPLEALSVLGFYDISSEQVKEASSEEKPLVDEVLELIMKKADEFDKEASEEGMRVPPMSSMVLPGLAALGGGVLALKGAKGARRLSALMKGGTKGMARQGQDDLITEVTKRTSGMGDKEKTRIFKEMSERAGVRGPELFGGKKLSDWGVREYATAGALGIGAPIAAKGIGNIIHGPGDKKQSIF